MKNKKITARIFLSPAFVKTFKNLNILKSYIFVKKKQLGFYQLCVQIDPYLATLSFLKVLRNWPKHAVLIWRRSEIWVHNYFSSCAQQPENLLSLWIFMLTNLSLSSYFWTDANFWQLLIYVRSEFSTLSYCSGILENLFIRNCAHKCFRQLLEFSHFHRIFANAPPGNRNGYSLVLLKGKRWK